MTEPRLSWAPPIKVPKPWSRKAQAGLLCGIGLALGLVLFAINVIAASVAAAEVQDLVEGRDQHVADSAARLEAKHPWVADLRADSVWDTQEWAAIAAAQNAIDYEEHQAATIDIRQRIDRSIPGPREILRGALDAYAPSPLADSAPLDDMTMATKPFLMVAMHGQRACDSDNPDSYIDSAADPSPFITEDQHELRQAWEEGAPLLIRTAASYACGNT